VAAADAAGCEAAAEVAAADGDKAGDEAAAEVAAGAEMLEVTGLPADEGEEATDAAHPATPAPATTAAAVTATSRPVSLVEPNIANPPFLAAQAPQQNNVTESSRVYDL